MWLDEREHLQETLLNKPTDSKIVISQFYRVRFINQL
jgi:hypothetical protein